MGDETPRYALRHMKRDERVTWCGEDVSKVECWEHGDEMKFCPTCYGALSTACHENPWGASR